MKAEVAVVTGAGSGFGRLTAETLAAAGWLVYGTLRDSHAKNAARAAALRECGVRVIDLDVTRDDSVGGAADRIVAEAGAIDVLINNAGITYYGVLEAFTPAALERQFATNVFGPMRVNRAFLPSMRERKGGLVIYLSSVLGRLVVPFTGPYTASKWALEALAETSRYELAPFGVDVAIVQPDAFPTNINLSISGADDASRLASYGDVGRSSAALFAHIDDAAQRRDPQEVADAIVRLANLPHGERPLRTTVPTYRAVDDINSATATIQRELLAAFGLGQAR
ncbi:MAG: SDR family oxidoreductase [Candidatus Eremiobacteraeota bacterium]|nr:SDR family oxidoreductase [Candidatus Eremiobacteraeota bacterium]